jgi:hypothetical protein
MISPSKSKRPKWSLKTHFWAAVLIAAVASACVLLISKKNIWIELEIIVGVLSLISFAYFLILFYHGIRFEKNETYSITWKPFKFDESWLDTIGIVDTGGLFSSAGVSRGDVDENRDFISLSHEMEIPMAEIARHVGGCGSAVAKAIQKMESAD